MTDPHGRKALKLVERFLDAKGLLACHFLLSDGENERVKMRIEKWALSHGLKRKE